MSDATVEIDMQIHAQTDKAVLVSDDGDKRKAVWLARSQISMEPRPKAIVRITMPEWMAIEKGFV